MLSFVCFADMLLLDDAYYIALLSTIMLHGIIFFLLLLGQLSIHGMFGPIE
jgi:hypothetical protein